MPRFPTQLHSPNTSSIPATPTPTTDDFQGRDLVDNCSETTTTSETRVLFVSWTDTQVHCILLSLWKERNLKGDNLTLLNWSPFVWKKTAGSFILQWNALACVVVNPKILDYTLRSLVIEIQTYSCLLRHRFCSHNL